MVLGQIGEEEGDMKGSLQGMVTFVVIAVGTGTMEHLARCARYATRSGLGPRHTGARGKRCSTVALEGLAKETLGAGRRTRLVVKWRAQRRGGRSEYLWRHS